MAAFYLFLISLMVLCFSMYVYDNERNMMAFKLECMEKIKELNKTNNLFKQDFVIIRQETEDGARKLNKVLETITTLDNSSKKDFSIVRQEIEDVSIRLYKAIETTTALEEATKKDLVIVMRRIEDVTIKLTKAVTAISALEEAAKKEKTMTCPNGWIMRELHCYIFIKTPKTWEKAADDCTAKQAKLIKISDSGMNSWVGSQMIGHGMRGSWIWIGLNDRLQEGNYVWHGDSSKLTFGIWHRKQPDNYRNLEDCIISDGTHWSDVSCSQTYPYACEKKTSLQ